MEPSPGTRHKNDIHMNFRRFPILVNCALASLFMAGMAHAQGSAPICMKSAEEAARRFVILAAAKPSQAVSLLTRRSLNSFRLRAQRMLEDRYAPASQARREKVLGSSFSNEKMRLMTDSEFVASYMAAGDSRGSVSDVQVLSHASPSLGGDELVVGYTVKAGAARGRQQRILSTRKEGDCWWVDMPLEAWVRLDEVGTALKATRTDMPLTRKGPPTASLQVVPASFVERPDMVQARRPGIAGPSGTVWLAKSPILTEADIDGAKAGYSCDFSAMEPEQPGVHIFFTDAGAEQLKQWSSENMGKVLAVAVNGDALVVATVKGILGKQLMLCLEKSTLEEAVALSENLMGWRK